MSRKDHTDVLVVGAGPVGLFAATELVRRNLSVMVFDQEWRGTGFSYALALHPGTLELFEDLDLADSLAEAGYRIDTLALREGPEVRARLDYGKLNTRYPFLTILPQNWLEMTLEEWLRKQGVKVQWKHRVVHIEGEGSPVSVTLERWGEDMTGYAFARKSRVIEKVFPVEAKLVLGADGHTSVVRHHLHLDFEEVGPPALFGVFEFQSDFDAGHEATLVLDESTMSILWPLPDRRFRWSFQLPDLGEFEGERVKSRRSELGHWIHPRLTEARLRELLKERAPWFTGTVEELFWSAPIRFERRLVSGFGRGGIWLAGDAAHITSPAGIQSMNVGLREARDLAERFEDVLQNRIPLAGLEGYDRERLAEWGDLARAGGALRDSPGTPEFIRKNEDRILTALPSSGDHLRGLLEQVGLELSRPEPSLG